MKCLEFWLALLCNLGLVTQWKVLVKCFVGSFHWLCSCAVLNLCQVVNFFTQPVFKLLFMNEVNKTNQINVSRLELHFISINWFIIYDLLHSTGQDLQLPRGKGHKRTSRSHTKVPHLTHRPIHVRKTATAQGSPYSFRIVRGFFYVPQNYQHSRNCEMGLPAYHPYPRRLESLTICRWNYI